MTYKQAISNIRTGKGIVYRKATIIKLNELAEIADRLVMCKDCNLISRQSALAEFKDGRDVYDIMESIEELPSAVCDDCIWHICNYNKVDWDADVVSKGVFDQVKWERDTALKTLEEHGIGFGEKVDRPNGRWMDYIGKDLGIEGQWLRDDGKTVFVQCNQCDRIFVRNLMIHMNYCPSCGAMMKDGDK